MKNAIQISGGLDSLAMLFLLRPQWDECVVMWCDSGASYLDTRQLMVRICHLVPHFMYVRGRQPESIHAFGWPVDVVPVRNTRNGEIIYGPQPIAFQSSFDCCARGRFLPLQEAVLASGVTTVYRGQRNDDRLRLHGLKSGDTDEFGITYILPLAEWTRERVVEFMEEVAPDYIPAYYAQGEKTSRDCWNCTAYRADNVERVNNLPQAKRESVKEVLLQWRLAVQRDMEPAL